MLTQIIFQQLKKTPFDPAVYYDFLNAARAELNELGIKNPNNISTEVPRSKWDEETKLIHALNLEAQGLVKKAIGTNIEEFFNIYTQSLLMEAPYDFGQYLTYLEINRPPEEKFYQPRQKTLAPLVDALQALEDDELDELLLSLPPRTGKTTILMFYGTWVMGRHPNKACLYTAFSNTITRTFYRGVMEILKDPITYKWNEVFPNVSIAETNAQDQTINLARKTRYPTITCRSIDGTLNGACDCDCISIADDLCSGIEQAMNKDRMMTLWQKVSNDYLSRAKSQAKHLWCGTRWSNLDPIGIRQDMLENDPAFKDVRYRVINTPALDENEESNFDYAYKVGFTTQDFIQKRAGFERIDDMASWYAQYMGMPIEREGALFESGDMQFFNGELPENPDRIFVACDPAFGGGDFTAGPVCFQYGDTIYIPDVIYSNEEKDKTMPQLIRKLKKWKVETVQFEANRMLQSYIDEFKQRLRAEKARVTVLTKPAPSNQNGKHGRIMDKAPDIREHMVFLDNSSRSKEYQKFMDNVYAFRFYAAKQHDDAPDSLAMAISMVIKYGGATTFRRFI
jgi:predicted phage terminase large subunit-like protein